MLQLFDINAFVGFFFYTLSYTSHVKQDKCTRWRKKQVYKVQSRSTKKSHYDRKVLIPIQYSLRLILIVIKKFGSIFVLYINCHKLIRERTDEAKARSGITLHTEFT